MAGDVTVAWDAVPSATGYRVHYGYGSRSYASSIDVKNVTKFTVPGLTDGARYFFAVTAYGGAGTKASGYSNEVSGVVSAVAAPPAAAFTATPSSGAAPLAVTFSDVSTGTVTARAWNFGDGSTASTSVVAKTYANPGSYTATLTVSNAKGKSSASRTITVNPAVPVAAFSGTPLTGTAPLTVNFTNRSTGAYTSSAWQFGDGSTSVSVNPSKSYTVPGVYTVTLKVTGAGAFQYEYPDGIRIGQCTGDLGWDERRRRRIGTRCRIRL